MDTQYGVDQLTSGILVATWRIFVFEFSVVKLVRDFQ